MKVCVFGGTNPATCPKWYDVAEEMGRLLVAEDFEKVWGGNAHGVLAQIAKEYQAKGAANTLFLPDAYVDDLEHMGNVDKVINTQTICQRAEAMLAAADAVVVMPGGIGTMFEFWTALEVRRAEEHAFEIVLLNYKGFFQHQIDHYNFIYDEGFTRIGKGGAPYKICPKDLFVEAATPADVIKVLKKLRAKGDKK